MSGTGKRQGGSASPRHSEGDINLTARRADWSRRSVDTETRGLLARDTRAFLHQSVSTPCLNAIKKAEGIWIEDEELTANAATVGAHAVERLLDMKTRHRIIGDVRGRGFLIGVELVVDREAKTPANDAAEKVLYRALDAGLSFKTTMGNVLTLNSAIDYHA